MIFTVFVSENDPDQQRKAELLEYSWLRSQQAGELVRLVPTLPQEPSPSHILAQVERSLCWTEHPYLDDKYPGYNVPAAVLEWLQREPVDATVLLLESGSVLNKAFSQEVGPGKPLAHRWENFPEGEGPFQLPESYAPLRAYCVRRDLSLPRLQLPLLIHSSDLFKICARWLEMMGIIRSCPDVSGTPPASALNVALAIALAEYTLEVEFTDLTDHVIEPENGGRQFLDYNDQYMAARACGEHLDGLLPTRKPGVRQACVQDQWYLELGSPPVLMTLNTSAAEIWKLCDGQRTLADIVRKLQAKYQIPLVDMVGDVTDAAKILRSQGAINLETSS